MCRFLFNWHGKEPCICRLQIKGTIQKLSKVNFVSTALHLPSTKLDPDMRRYNAWAATSFGPQQCLSHDGIENLISTSIWQESQKLPKIDQNWPKLPKIAKKFQL